MHSTTMPSSGVNGGGGAGRALFPAAAAATTGTVMVKVEPRPAGRAQRQLVLEDAGHALDDGKPEPEAARHPRALVEALELLEDDLLLARGDAEAGVDDLDAQLLADAPAAHQHRESV